MANWRIYMRDRAAGLIASGVISATHNATYAANVTDVNNATVWTPGATVTDAYIYFDLGGSYPISAVGIGGHSLSGETVIIYSANAFTGGVATERKSSTALGSGDQVLTFSSATAQYWRIRISSQITGSQRVATISLLDNNYIVEFEYPSAPAYPIGADYIPGSAVGMSRAGHEFRQTLGGVSAARSFNFDFASTAQSGDPGYDVDAFYRELAGCPNGVWVTDDSLTSTSDGIGRGYYGHIQSVGIPIAYPGARSSMTIAMREMPGPV